MELFFASLFGVIAGFLSVGYNLYILNVENIDETPGLPSGDIGAAFAAFGLGAKIVILLTILFTNTVFGIGLLVGGIVSILSFLLIPAAFRMAVEKVKKELQDENTDTPCNSECPAEGCTDSLSDLL